MVSATSPPLQLSNVDDPDTDFFNHNTLPAEVKERVINRSDPTKFTLGSRMTRYRNEATVNSHGEMHECNFIPHSITLKKWLITRSGAVFNTSAMTTRDTKDFLANFPRMLGKSAAFHCIWCSLLEDHCSQCKVFAPPIDEQCHCDNS